MDYKLIYDVLKENGFCGHNMADEKFVENGTCAWENGSFEMRCDDPECTFETCLYIQILKQKVGE